MEKSISEEILFESVIKNDFKLFKSYPFTNENIDFTNELGETLLMTSIKHERTEFVEYILRFNPNLYLTDIENTTIFPVAEKLKDKTIYLKLLEKCWGINDNLYLFEYNVKFETSEQEAFLNCWIMDTDLNNAKERTIEFIEKENLEIISFENITEMKKKYENVDEKHFQYYEQAIIDKEVFVFYEYTDE